VIDLVYPYEPDESRYEFTLFTQDDNASRNQRTPLRVRGKSDLGVSKSRKLLPVPRPNTIDLPETEAVGLGVLPPIQKKKSHKARTSDAVFGNFL
jgi:hypothetical protein